MEIARAENPEIPGVCKKITRFCRGETRRRGGLYAGKKKKGKREKEREKESEREREQRGKKEEEKTGER